MPQDFPNILLESELKKLLNRIAAGLDRIINKVLKEVYKKLALYLVKVLTIVV